MSEKVENLMSSIKELTVLELNSLVKALEAEFNVSAAMTVANVASNVNAESSSNEIEKTEFDVLLKKAGPNKIKVIKAVKDLTGLGLKESKDIVDNPPKTLKEKLNKEEAEGIKKQLEDLGAEIEVK